MCGAIDSEESELHGYIFTSTSYAHNPDTRYDLGKAMRVGSGEMLHGHLMVGRINGCRSCVSHG
jgi:hypothetical protein